MPYPNYTENEKRQRLAINVWFAKLNNNTKEKWYCIQFYAQAFDKDTLPFLDDCFNLK